MWGIESGLGAGCAITLTSSEAVLRDAFGGGKH